MKWTKLNAQNSWILSNDAGVVAEIPKFDYSEYFVVSIFHLDVEKWSTAGTCPTLRSAKHMAEYLINNPIFPEDWDQEI